MSNFTLTRANIDGKKRELLATLRATPVEALTEDDVDLMFMLTFTPEQRTAILAQKD